MACFCLERYGRKKPAAIIRLRGLWPGCDKRGLQRRLRWSLWARRRRRNGPGANAFNRWTAKSETKFAPQHAAIRFLSWRVSEADCRAHEFTPLSRPG